MRHFLLHHLLREAATRAGGRPAVLDGDRCLTYAELDRRSDQLAHLLRALGVLPGDRVGLYLDKSLEAVIGIYGTLKAGAAYVPLDAKAPPPRLAQVVRSCGMRHLLTAVGKATTWRALLEPASGVGVLLALDGAPPADATPPSVRVVGPAAMRDQPASPPDSEITVDLDPAYILYTSGSTGVPKGVVLTHRNALSFVDWSVEAFAVSGSDRLSSAAPFHFDLSVFDLFAAASAAATLVLVPPTALTLPQELRDFILRTSISVWYSVPSLLSLLVVRGGLRRAGLPSLRTVLFAGEVFPTPHLRRLMQMLPGARFANLYGPTETNVCMWFDVPRPLPAGDDPVPIGRAIDNLHVFARTHDGRLVTAGEVGELCVRGSSVMRGYWGDPVATARSFLPEPFRPGLDAPAYRTGDLVRLLDDGNYRFLGRRDGQVKTRGHRVELGEIESTLYGHEAVAECAAVAVPDDLVSNRIRAYVVLNRDVAAEALRRWCAARIPRYMVPDSFDSVAALPRTSTGKVDRQALCALAGSSAAP